MVKGGISSTAVDHLEVRCQVCRRRDWERGGPGRGDKVGVLDHLVRGWAFTAWQRLPGERREPGTVPVVLGETVPVSSGVRAKCRRGHRINRTGDDVAQRIAGALRAGQTTVYL